MPPPIPSNTPQRPPSPAPPPDSQTQTSPPTTRLCPLQNLHAALTTELTTQTLRLKIWPFAQRSKLNQVFTSNIATLLDVYEAEAEAEAEAEVETQDPGFRYFGERVFEDVCYRRDVLVLKGVERQMQRRRDQDGVRGGKGKWKGKGKMVCVSELSMRRRDVVLHLDHLFREEGRVRVQGLRDGYVKLTRRRTGTCIKGIERVLREWICLGCDEVDGQENEMNRMIERVVMGLVGGGGDERSRKVDAVVEGLFGGKIREWVEGGCQEGGLSGKLKEGREELLREYERLRDSILEELAELKVEVDLLCSIESRRNV